MINYNIKGVEATISNVGRLSKKGMSKTNEEVTEMMIGELKTACHRTGRLY